jgi:hypothetical protein
MQIASSSANSILECKNPQSENERRAKKWVLGVQGWPVVWLGLGLLVDVEALMTVLVVVLVVVVVAVFGVVRSVSVGACIVRGAATEKNLTAGC